MRVSAIALLLLAMLAPAVAQSKRRPARPATEMSDSERQARETEDRAAIQRLQQRYIAAAMSLDIDALLSLWTDDGVLLAPQHPPVTGHAALRKFYQQQQNDLGNVEMLGYEEQWQEVRLLGDYAWQWGQIHARMRTGQSKAESSTVMNALRILRREENGAWKVARAIYNEAQASTSIGEEHVPEGEQR